MPRMTLAVSLLALCAGAWPTLAQAQTQTQDPLSKLEKVQTTGYGLKFQMVEQGGPNAEAIRKNLQQVKLPPGFKIDLYAIVPDARAAAAPGEWPTRGARARAGPRRAVRRQLCATGGW